MKKYLFIIGILFTCGISVFAQDMTELKIKESTISSVSPAIPYMEIRRYGSENAPLDGISFYANVEYLLVVQPLSGPSTSYNFYWRLLSATGVVLHSHNVYNCGVHLAIYGMKAPEPGNYTVEVDVESYDKTQRSTFVAPFVVN